MFTNERARHANEEIALERYLIETPHTAENCLALLEEVHAQGYLNNFDWGCRAGTHTGWVVIAAESEEQARMAVPPLVRARAHVTRLNKFDCGDVASLHPTGRGDAARSPTKRQREKTT